MRLRGLESDKCRAGTHQCSCLLSGQGQAPIWQHERQEEVINTIYERETQPAPLHSPLALSPPTPTPRQSQMERKAET